MKKTVSLILTIMLIFGFTGGPLNYVYATSGPTYVTGGTNMNTATLLTNQNSYLQLIPEQDWVDDGFGGLSEVWYNNNTYFKFTPTESGTYTLTISGSGDTNQFEFAVLNEEGNSISYVLIDYDTTRDVQITVQAGVLYYIYISISTKQTTSYDVEFDKPLQSSEGASEPSVLTIDPIDDITMNSLNGGLPSVTVRDDNGDEVTGKTKKYTCEELSDYGAYISGSDRYIELGSSTPNGTYTVTVSLADDSAEPITFDIIVKIIRPASIVLSPQNIELVKDGTENSFTVNFPAAAVYDNEGNQIPDVECGIIDGDFEALGPYVIEEDDEGAGEGAGFQLSKEIPLGTYRLIYGLHIESKMKLRSDSEEIPEITSDYEIIVRNPKLTYAASAGGNITGETSQTVTSGASGTTVTAVADDGFTFSQWSDGVTTASRTDTNVSADLSVTAEFETMLTVNIDESSVGDSLQEKVETILDGKSTASVAGLNITAGELTDDDVLWITNNLTELETLSITDNASFTDDTLPNGAFKDLVKLKSVAIDLDTTESLSFGNYAFHYCYSLEAVDIPQAVAFGVAAFQNNYKLTQVLLPKAKSFGGNSFNECKALTDISLPNTEAVGVASFVHCIRLKNVDLPKLEVVGKQMFTSCEELISVNLLNAKEFGDYIFWGCKKPIEMKLGNVPPAVIYDAAQSYSGTFGQYMYEGSSKVLIPEEALEAYKATDGWDEASFSWYGWPAETYSMQSSDDSLSDLKVDGMTIVNFTPEMTTYELGSTTKSSITISAVENDENATVTGDVGTLTMTTGSNTFSITVTAENGSTRVYTLTVTREVSSGSESGDDSSSGGSSSGGSRSKPKPQIDQASVAVIVNGKAQNAGKETTTTENGKTTVTVAVDNKAIESKIDEAIKTNKAETDNVIQVPVADTKSEAVKVELTGDIVKKLEENQFDVSVKRDNVEYVIPAEEFTISTVADHLGVAETDLADIKVDVKITKLDEKVIDKYNEVAKANGAELVFPPVSFEVVAKTTKVDGKTVEQEVSKFSNYVERVMEIPAGVDPNKVTTGIVFNPDGTYSHVPTTLYQKDGKWYASLNSLTNSNYSVVWNPITVKSVANHWAKDAANDMASRLVIMNPESFKPNKAITRADFAEYIVRALGLYREESTYENKFKDVSSTGERTLAILIANEYGIVSGYSDGTFRGENQITREEAMTMYQRAMKITKLIGMDESRYQNYIDYDQVGSWATAYVKEVLSAHVFNGTSDATISPKPNMTYAEAAQAIQNLLVESKLINNSTFPPRN